MSIFSTKYADEAMMEIGNYIQHNQSVDLQHNADILKQAGYQEVMGADRYYRVLFHTVTPQDKEQHMTIGDLYDTLKRDVRFDIEAETAGGPEYEWRVYGDIPISAVTKITLAGYEGTTKADMREYVKGMERGYGYDHRSDEDEIVKRIMSLIKKASK
jgi:hypothetical protein